jgi:DNA replication and repair protein RecF
MKLDRVQITQFRNMDTVSFTPNANLNVFLGENGSGKSSILEAIHYLGFARSFRTTKHKNVIRQGQASFTVFCAVTEADKKQKFGISRATDDSCEISINGQKSRKATDLVSFLPIQIFTPQSSDLLLGAPKLRRRYLDWLLFHVEQSFNQDSGLFAKSLKQINALYKNRDQTAAASYWQDIFCKYGEVITQYRQQVLDNSLLSLINCNLKEFLPEFSFEISYYRGWDKDSSLAESLARAKDKDLRNGFVSVGPHKADLRVKTLGVAAHEVLSRGQLRMLVAAMQLAQTEYLHSQTDKSSVFLLDDIGAELDEEKRRLFIARLNTVDTQLFVTAIEGKQLEFLQSYHNKKVFHVEHGQVREEI